MVEELQEFCHSVMLPWIVELAAILSFAYIAVTTGEPNTKCIFASFVIINPLKVSLKQKQCFSIDLSKSERDC